MKSDRLREGSKYHLKFIPKSTGNASVKRNVFRLLSDLFVESLEDPLKGKAIILLHLHCKLASRKSRSFVPMAELLEGGRTTFSMQQCVARAVIPHVIGEGKFLGFRGEAAGKGSNLKGSVDEQGQHPLIEPQPEVIPVFAELCEKTRRCALVLARVGQLRESSWNADPLRQVVAEGALCFNEGLFFEMHEHLERVWRIQPPGPTKRFLQALIQISVGFHHAQRGSFDGTVNQLAKGLEKTAGMTGEMLGVDCTVFLPSVATARQTILARGRAGMRPMPLDEIPRLPVSR